MKTIIIQGSSNPKGNTYTITNFISKQLNADILDLTTLDISPFDYQFNNQNDDFNKTAHNLLDSYDLIIFSTPVYWYTMSGIMKNFFDRFTGGLLKDNALGRKFEHKKMATIACGSSSEPIEGFFIPFVKSAEYLKMNYLGNTHLWIGAEDNKKISKKAYDEINHFVSKIQ